MKTRVATIILSRNMPVETNKLVEWFHSYNNGETDIYIVESGSERSNLSQNYTWWANWDEAMRDGLRYPRGFNYGLSRLIAEGRFSNYDYFFLVCNDVVFFESPIPVLMNEMDAHPRLGILSPCAENWQESSLIGKQSTAYVWYLNHLAWMVRRQFVEAVMERDKPDHMNLLYDGSNFRGYCADLEVVIKGYINEWASAITTRALMREDTNLLLRKSDLMQSDSYAVNRRLVFEEGQNWMRRKYGFTTRPLMHAYATMFYDRFFHLNPDLTRYRLASAVDRAAAILEEGRTC